MKRQRWYLAAVACLIAVVFIVDYAQTFGSERSPVVVVFCLFLSLMFWVCIILGRMGRKGLPLASWIVTFVVYVFLFVFVMNYVLQNIDKKNTPLGVLCILGIGAGLIMAFWIPTRVYKKVNKILNGVKEEKMNRLKLSFLILVYWLAAFVGLMTFVIFSSWFWMKVMIQVGFFKNPLGWLMILIGVLLNAKLFMYIYGKTHETINKKIQLFLQNETAQKTAERLDREEAECAQKEAYQREQDLKKSIYEAKQGARAEFEEEARTWPNDRIRAEINDLWEIIRENRRMIRQNEREIERRERRRSYPGRGVENLNYGARQMEDEIDSMRNKIDFLKSILANRGGRRRN